MKQDQQKKQAIINNTVGLPQDVDNLLKKFAKKQHKSKNDYIVYAILNQIENEMDIEIAEKRLSKNAVTISHEELKRELEMED